jgi:hypothetical protein
VICQEEPGQQPADEQAQDREEEVERHLGALLLAVTLPDARPPAGLGPVYELRNVCEPIVAARYTSRL